MWAVIVAAGRGERFGGPKALIPLLGRPLVGWSLEAFARSGVVDGAVVVVRPQDADAIRRLAPPGLDLAVMPGGERRRDSVRSGLDAVGAGRVLIHDAARPLVPPDLVRRVASAAGGAVVPGLPVSDTLRRDAGGRLRSVDREGIYLIQTPQAFEADDLKRRLEAEAGDMTDEAMLYETEEEPIGLVPGDARNIKITYASDLALAEAIVSSGAIQRVGHGYDIHRTAEGGPLRLGGIDISGTLHTIGHSDGDVLLHAVADALLGAAGLPDIGQYFPPGDDASRGLDSAEIVRRAVDELARCGLVPVQVDATVVAEAPRIGPHREAICAAMASLTGLSTTSVNVKATTEEGMGEVGAGRAIRAYALAVVLPRPWARRSTEIVPHP